MAATAVFSVVKAWSDTPQMTETNIYVVDSELMRLLPIETEIIDGAPDFKAGQALRVLINGYDNNRKIRRLIPDDSRSLTLKVRNGCANIDIHTKRLSGINSRDIERLFIYQLVNTLTSIDGIDTVRFTIDGEQKKRFAGYMDMREIFVHDPLV